LKAKTDNLNSIVLNRINQKNGPVEKMRNAISLIVCILCLAACQTGQSQSAVARDSSVRFFGVPLVFYTPDTYWGAGAAGIVTFPGVPLRSSITFSLAYTQRRQFLIYFPYQWFGAGGRWRAYGEVGWYRYLYQFFGIGNEVPNDFLEVYTAQYPRLRVTAARKINAHQLVGLRWFFDDYRIRARAPGGLIEQGEVPGAAGGISSAVGPVWIYDARDNQFFPHRGWLAEASLVGEAKPTGSDFRYARFSCDVVRYWPVSKHTVLVINGLMTFTAGEPAFFLLPQLGGPRRLRGYADGKYRDRHLILAQAEWRFPLFWRFKGVVFGGGGSVFGAPGESLRLRPNGGAGLRFEFDRKQRLHLRVDYGIGAGRGNSGLYVTVGEAF
jgi:hypothetical protein